MVSLPNIVRPRSGNRTEMTSRELSVNILNLSSAGRMANMFVCSDDKQTSDFTWNIEA